MGSDEIEPAPYGPLLRFVHFVLDCFDRPVTWFRETVVLPNHQKTYWYHQQYRRVPTIDQCYEDDVVCIYEANQQYIRDRQVEKNILHILRRRADLCYTDNKNQDPNVCLDIINYYKSAVDNYFIKYGDLGKFHSAYSCFMKQKHRMAWERRHGPVGTGRKEDREAGKI